MNELVSDFGTLNGACKSRQYFWGIKKNSWEDFYRIEVSNHNFDSRPSLHDKVEHIDDALLKMNNFIKTI